VNILTIAGSDPSAGAGIQSDIKTFSALNAYGFSVVTAITSQNTSKFSEVEPISPKMIISQIDSILFDFKIDAIKIGMVFNSVTIKTVYEKIRKMNLPIILDPVIKSSTGGILLEKNALAYFKKYLIPISTVITPNVRECEKLTGVKIKTEKDLLKAAKVLKKIGAKNVVITGFESKGKIIDFISIEKKQYTVYNKKIHGHNHGSGCNFSAALTVSIASKKNFQDSIMFARDFTYKSIKNAKKIGKGLSVTNFKKSSKIELELEAAITNLIEINQMWSIIPECQTNFVFSKNKPKSIKDIFGMQGRIVKAGNRVIPSGDIKLGGSKHVASAVLQMNKKFPQIRSGINIKYNEKILKRLKQKHFKITSYNRKKEPPSFKNKENSSIIWGINSVTKDALKPFDAIFHKGDFGKEPMIIIFGKNPHDVVGKIVQIF